MKWVVDGLLAVVVGVLVLPLLLLPRRAAAWCGRRYGDLGWIFYGLGRRTAAINLRRAYGPAMTRQRARRLIRVVFENLTASLAEGLWGVRPSAAAILTSPEWVTYEHPEVTHRAMTDPRPKILVTAHLGSWDLMVILARLTHGPGAVVQRSLDNRVLQAVLARARARLGDTIDKRGAAGACLARLRKGESVAMIVDENAGPRGCFVPFFGRPASAHRTPALLALQTGCPLVMAVLVRRPQGTYLCRAAWFDPTDAETRWTVDSLTAAMVAQLEVWVRDDPEQWRWIHWRWKTRPDGSEERYDRPAVHACFKERPS